MRLRVDLAYDGTEFRGWASQPGQRTVQSTLEDAITTVLRLPGPASLTVAGRTDAGVHAAQQVAHLDLPDGFEMTDRGEAIAGPVAFATHLERRLRRVLPSDVAIHRVQPAPEAFDARFGAIWRRYCYRIWDDASRPDPVLRHRTATVRGTVHVDDMVAAADLLVGLHDFAAFCKPRAGATTIRTLLDAEVRRTTDATQTIEVWWRADAFCHSMVRSITGALVAVGRHQHPAGWVSSLLDATRRQSSITVLPAAGLTLEQVGYPADNQLADRVRVSRARRDEDAGPPGHHHQEYR